MTKTYDFVIIGAGVFGSWTAYNLRSAGFKVALLDAYGPGNNRSSSGGETRIIRMGYGPDKLYTTWSAHSLERWKEFSQRSGQQLFHKTGVLWLTNNSDRYVDQTHQVLKDNGVPCRELTADEIRRNYPQLSFPDGVLGIFEPESGVLMAREAVQAVVKECLRKGVAYCLAHVVPPATSSRLESVRTSAGESLSASAFIFACGPWLPKLFPDLLAQRIRPTRQEVFFFGVPAGNDAFNSPKMPVWLHHTHPLRPYALPNIASRGFKIALDRHGPSFDPDTDSRVVTEGSVAEVRRYLVDHVPTLHNGPVVETRVCQYENTSNGDFLIDRHPELENVWLVGGGSGHGFKHGPAVGEYVKSLVLGPAAAEPRFSLSTKQSHSMRAVF
jgi:sarcosine oxidase